MATPLRVDMVLSAAVSEKHSAGLPSGAVLPPVVTMPAPARVRRRISPVSGHALEILGHAVEYLADEYVLASGALPSIHAHDPQVEAMQLLMQANRAVYFECPVIPSLRVRARNWFKGRIFGPALESA